MVTTRWLPILLLASLAGSARADEDDLDPDELPNAVPSVMDRRWSTSFGYGPATHMPSSPDFPARAMLFFELAQRYRVVPSLEVGASFGGSVNHDDGYVALHGDVRYRLMAEMPWNVFVLASLGGGRFGPSQPTRLIVRGGAGIERRFVNWAFAAEVQLARLDGNDEDPFMTIVSPSELFGAWNASVSLSAIYYWGKGRRRIKPQVERERR